MSLSPSFTQLEAADLVKRLNDADLAYIFKHGLVQDTAYGSMLKHDRKRLHRLIGESLEREYPEALEENAARMAQHFAEAGDDAKTFHYANLAGDAAARVYANQEAINFYLLAVRVAKSLDFDTAQWIELYTKLGRVYEVSNQFDRAIALYQEMEQLAARSNNDALRLAALLLAATLYATPTPLFDEARGLAGLEPTLELARKLHDGEAEAKIYWIYLLLNGFRGRGQEAVAYGEKGIALARALGLKERLAFLLNDIATFGYSIVGPYEKARAASNEARGLWEELVNRPMLADNLNNAAIFNTLEGNYTLAQTQIQRAYEISESINNLWGISLARMDQGIQDLEHGEMEHALHTLQRAYDDMLEHGLGLMIIGSTILSLVYAELGAIDEGYAVMPEELGTFDIPLYRAPNRCAFIYLTLLRGDLARARQMLDSLGELKMQDGLLMPLAPILAIGEVTLAEKKYDETIRILGHWVETMDRLGIRSFVADALGYVARAQLALGEIPAARKNLQRAREMAEQLGSARSLWKILERLAALERDEGNIELANQLDAQARAIVDSIAARTPEEYRATFHNKLLVTSR